MTRISTIITSFVLVLALASFAAAHGGFDHVQGTIVKVDNNVLTVKTAKGNVDVKLNPKTELTKNGKAAQTADLVPNARVVVDVEEGKDIAHSVKIGAAAAAAKTAEHADHADHSAHK